MRSLIKPLIRSNFRSTIKNALEPVINYAYNLNGIDSGVTLLESVSIPSDFRLTFKMKYIESGWQTLLGSSELNNYLAITSPSQMRLQQSSGFSLLSLDNALVDGEVYSVVISRVGNELSANFSGYSTGLKILSSVDELVFNNMFKHGTSNRSKGYYYDIILDSGDVAVIDSKMNSVSSEFINLAGSNLPIDNYNSENWIVREEYNETPILLGVNGARQRMESSSSGESGYNYIITGDSTRFNGYNRMIEMYQTQLDKINMARVNNSQSGQSATRWLANEGGATLNAALAATPDDGRKTIMEFSFGLNDYSLGLTRTEIKQTLHNCISAYSNEKPNAIIFLVSPVPTANLERNEMMQTIYEQISVERDLFLVDGNSSMINVLGNSDYYQDGTHPNSNGSLRLLNWILSELSPVSLYNTITMDSTWLWPEPLPSSPLEDNISVNLYDDNTGDVVINADGRKMDRVDVEPNFELNIRHQGNLNTVIFFDFDNVKVASMTYDPSSDQSIIVPAPAIYAMINISDNGGSYDALNDAPTVRYVSERVANLTMPEINAGNNINLLDIT